LDAGRPHELDEIDSSAAAESFEGDEAVEPSVIAVAKAAGVDSWFVVRARPDPLLVELVALEASQVYPKRVRNHLEQS
jgi:hypothetical protein